MRKLRTEPCFVGSIRCLQFACAALMLTLTSARTAAITIAATYTVTLDISPTVGGLILGATSGSSTQSFSLNGFTFTLAGPATVNSRGSFTVDSGSLSGTANSSISGTLGWTAGTLAGTLTLAAN